MASVSSSALKKKATPQPRLADHPRPTTPEDASASDLNKHLHNGDGGVGKAGEKDRKAFDKPPITTASINYSLRAGKPPAIRSTSSTASDWPAPLEPLATHGTSSEVSADRCSDLVRYEPKKGARRVNRAYAEWSARQEMHLRPPIVFNGTFPIVQPISSRFMMVGGRPATIDEERDSEWSTKSSGSSSSCGSEKGTRPGRLRGSSGRVLRRLGGSEGTSKNNNKVRFRKRARSRPTAEE